MSTSDSTRTSRRRRRSNKPLILVCGILATLLVGIVVFIKGSVSGTEFSPNHFQTRDFSFYEIPILSVQITPVSRKNTTGKTASHLRTSSLITAPRGKQPDDWQLVSISRGPSSTPAHAALLTQALELQNENGFFWIEWNKANPNRAAVLWPVIQRLARRELYVLIPELMELARSLSGDDDGELLSAAVDPWLEGQYVELVKDLREADRTPLADELLVEMLADYPDSADLKKLTGDGMNSIKESTRDLSGQ